MNRSLYLVLVLVFSLGAICSAQTKDELQDMIRVKSGLVEDHEAQIQALADEIQMLQSKLDIIAGWRKGVNGVIGFDFDRSRKWISNPNPNARAASLDIGIVGYLHNDQVKTFWNNTATIQKAWLTFDPDSEDAVTVPSLFDSGTLDILNISSLYGYRLTDKLAVSVQAELYSSISNLTDRGTIDVGAGLTWIPTSNLTLTLNPINYHYAYTDLGFDATGNAGAKLRIDYLQPFKFFANECSFTSSLTSFIPYAGKNDVVTPFPVDFPAVSFSPTLREYTWLNTLTLNLWKGIGLGLGWGLRWSGFEALPGDTPKLQRFFNSGLSVSF